MSYWRFKPYVSVAKRRAKAKRKLSQLARQGHVAAPVEIDGRTIATTFWGKSWCDHLEAYSDFASRLPRGRTYVRNGSVVDLQIEGGRVTALVSGSEIYQVTVTIQPLKKAAWNQVKSRCGGRIGSLVELLQGRLSNDVMQVVTHRDEGLFPKSREISMKCTCPDWAGMCKHVAATLYGVGARLDQQPELLFVLRQVDHHSLVDEVKEIAAISKTKKRRPAKELSSGDLAEIFGIEIDAPASTERKSVRAARPKTSPPAARQSAGKRKPKAVNRKPAATKTPTPAFEQVTDAGDVDSESMPVSRRKPMATGTTKPHKAASPPRGKFAGKRLIGQLRQRTNRREL